MEDGGSQADSSTAHSIDPLSSILHPRSSFGVPAWVQWRLAQMEEDRFIAEALAFETIGRFEHPGTGSVRMESAIAKMLTSEVLHRVIEHAEEIHGLASQTEHHLIEKRKRDARVLTIYEGTNEIQRFFILKDLTEEVAPRWKNNPASPTPHLGREALELEALKLQFRQRVANAIEFFGREVWQNPNLQANCFLLSEAAAWLKAADSTLGRLAWLERSQESEVGGQESVVRSRESDSRPPIPGSCSLTPDSSNGDDPCPQQSFGRCSASGSGRSPAKSGRFTSVGVWP